MLTAAPEMHSHSSVNKTNQEPTMRLHPGI
jgi:hypothetical protein